jgi:hypothetical protein
MAEKCIECLVRGVVDVESLQELIPILQVLTLITSTRIILF